MSSAPMSLGDVLDAVGVRRGFAEHRLSTVSTEARPWYVQTAVAAVIWVGALFFASFLGAMRVFEDAALSLLLGLGLFVLGGIGARLKNGLLRLHIALVCYAGCTGLLIAFCDRALSLGDRGEILCAGLVQLACLAWFDSRPVRFKAVVGVCLAALAYAIQERGIGMDVLVLSLSAVTTLWWTEEARLLASPVSRAVRPVGFGLVVASLGIGWLTLLDWSETKLHFPLVVTVGLGAVFMFVVVRAARESGAGLKTGGVVIALAGVMAAASLSQDMPAVLVSGLVIVLGRLRREPLLEGLGALALGASLLWVYYNLDLSLLYTSGALAAAALLTFAARAFVLRGNTERVELSQDASVLSPVGVRIQRATHTVLVPMVVVVAVVLGLVGHKEQMLKDGTTVILPLAPVDPRSLLQGDYMRLRYQHASDVPTSIQSSGTVWVNLADDHVVTSVHSTRFTPGARDQGVRIKWHRVRGDVVFGADSFFFQEGAADRMAKAKFVEARVAADGTPVLVHLLDEAKVAIQP